MIHHLYSNIVADCQEFSPYTNFTQLYRYSSWPFLSTTQRVVGQFCYSFNTYNKIWWNFYQPIVALISNSIPAEHFLRPFKYSLRNTKQFKLSSSLPPWNNLKTTRRYIHATLFLESIIEQSRLFISFGVVSTDGFGWHCIAIELSN